MDGNKMELANEAELLSADYETYLCVHVDAWKEFCRKNRKEIVAALRVYATILAAPEAAPRLHTTFCGDCQTHYFNHERHLCTYPTSV